MKHLLSLLVLLTLLIAPATVAISATDYKGTKPHHYDLSANMALRDKLKADFHKKYKVNETTYAYPINAYNLEVSTPYYQMMDKELHYVD